MNKRTVPNTTAGWKDVAFKDGEFIWIPTHPFARSLGAAAGFEIGMVILHWLGLAILIVWIGQALARIGSAFGTFPGGVWNARGDAKKLDLATQQFAEAIGVRCGVLIEAL